MPRENPTEEERHISLLLSDGSVSGETAPGQPGQPPRAGPPSPRTRARVVIQVQWQATGVEWGGHYCLRFYIFLKYFGDCRVEMEVESIWLRSFTKDM